MPRDPKEPRNHGVAMPHLAAHAVLRPAKTRKPHADPTYKPGPHGDAVRGEN